MKKKRMGRKLLSFLLTLAMVVGLMPGMGMTAYADWDGDPYAKSCGYYNNSDFQRNAMVYHSGQFNGGGCRNRYAAGGK